MLLTLLIIYTGHVTQVENTPGFAIAEADGRVVAISSEGPKGCVSPTDTTKAHFKTTVRFKDGAFEEAGRVDIGSDGYLIVETAQPGIAIDAPDGTSSGSATWRIVSGGGKFKGATGFISNNSTSPGGDSFTDHQIYKIVLPDNAK